MFNIELVEKVKIEIVEKYSNHSAQELMHVVLLEFYFLNLKIDSIMKSQAEVAQELRDIKAALLPLGPKIQALLDAAKNQPDASQELSDAADDLATEEQNLVALFTPAPAEPPAEAPAEPAVPAESEGTDATATE